MKTVKQLAEETFGKTKDGKGLVALEDIEITHWMPLPELTEID